MAGVTAIQAEVIARLGSRTDINARSLVWMNDAYFELLLSPRFPFWELDGSTTFTTVAGTRTYSLAAVTDLWFILDLRDTTAIRRLERVDVRDFDEIQHVSGQPTRYARFANTLELDPTPDAADVIQVRYRKRPNELVIGGVHLLGREWDEILTQLAVLKGREALEQTEQAAAQRTLVEGLLGMREAVLQLEDADADTTIGPELRGWR